MSISPTCSINWTAGKVSTLIWGYENSRPPYSTALSNAFLDKVLTLFSSGSRPTISWCNSGSPLFAPFMIGAIYLIFTIRLTSICSLVLWRPDVSLSRSQHGRHGVQRSWVRQVNHSEVDGGQQTLKRVYLTKSGIRLADLLQHLRWKLKGNARLSKLKKRAKFKSDDRKHNEKTNKNLTTVTYVWSWLLRWENSKL